MSEEKTVLVTPFSYKIENITEVYKDDFEKFADLLMTSAVDAIEQFEAKYSLMFTGTVNFWYGGSPHCGPQDTRWRVWKSIKQQGLVSLEREASEGKRDPRDDGERNRVDLKLYFPIDAEKECILPIDLVLLVHNPIDMKDELAKLIVARVMSNCRDSFMAQYYTAYDAILHYFRCEYRTVYFSRKEALNLAKELGIEKDKPMLSALDTLYFERKLRCRTAYDGENPPSDTPYRSLHLVRRP